MNKSRSQEYVKLGDKLKDKTRSQEYVAVSRF